MSTASAAPPPAQALEQITTTLADFREDCTTWQREFDALLDEFEAALDCDPPAGETAAGPLVDEQLASLDHSLNEQRAELSERHDQLSADLTNLRQLVDQQVKLFAAWINTTSQLGINGQDRQSAKDSDALNGVVADIIAQFERSQAGAAGIEASSAT